MPPKRIASLGRMSSDAKRKARERDAETPHEKRARLTRQTAALAAETPQQTQARLQDQRARQTAAIADENPQQTQARLQDQRARQTAARDAETPQQAQARITADQSRQAAATGPPETPQNRQVRIQVARYNISAARSDQVNWSMAAFNYQSSINYAASKMIVIGGMTKPCPNCAALKWVGETTGMCCSNGKVKLPNLQDLPEPLKALMSGETSRSRHFLRYIRKYNSSFQMTSFGAHEITGEGTFWPTFKVQGQVYHSAGSLLPVCDQPQFLQIYFVIDQQKQAEERQRYVPGTELDIILDLQQMLHQHHVYINLFKTALERMPLDEYKVVIRADKRPAGGHERQFNAPTVNEVAIVIVGDEFERRDIVLHKRKDGLQRIAETHRSYDTLQYPLIFWQGEDGYHFEISQTDRHTGNPVPGKKVSASDFYAYRIMQRLGKENHVLNCREVFHQFIVDMYAKIESERLLFIRLNQKKLRAEEYIHLRDAMVNEGNVNNAGQLVILPSSFTGSPRYMHEYTQDAMTYVRNYGRPDLFITFTCNPLWKEILAELKAGQAATHRHDLTARVFRQKLIKLMGVITKAKIFGQTRCYMYSIEWQKRGLPHAHILLWLKDKIRPNQIDNAICAELPNKDEDPGLFQVIKNNMIHGPCGRLNPKSACMKDGRCSKNYPRALLQETQTGEDGYPLYRRRKPGDGGFSTQIKGIPIDNAWVVPYCPLLSKAFEAHINVEYCQSVKAIKYICKYVNKGSDLAAFGLQKEGARVDEIDRFQTGRYISSNEAVWRILHFPIHERYPTVVHLSVHLENGQRVYFTEENVGRQLIQPPSTTLTAFFTLCSQDDFAKTLLYCEVPRYYTWNACGKLWKRRVKGSPVQGYDGIMSADALGRVYTVHPNNFECYFMRLLLHTVRGPTSFGSLKTVDGHMHESFRAACHERGLLESDVHWDQTMQEAAVSQSPTRLRELFAILLTVCGLSNQKQLWDSHKEFLSEDVLQNARRQNPGLRLNFTPAMFNQSLILLEDKVYAMVGKTLQQLSLPATQRGEEDRFGREMLRETNYNMCELQKYITANECRLVADQRAVYDRILQMVTGDIGGVIFLDAPGGTGKTFVINLLLATVRFQSKIALAVASTGIASTLLHGGRTAHSAFKLPLNLVRTDSPLCNISKGTGAAKVLQESKMIVWDECTMSHKSALEALDRTLQDLRGNTKVMGGLVLVLAGDFRQTLPVIPKGTPADELNACIKQSYLWRHVEKMSLTTNMRVHIHSDASARRFANHLLALGNGLAEADPLTGMISFPADFCCLVKSLQELQQKVFPDIEHHLTNHKWLCERAILAPKNDSVQLINMQIIKKIVGNPTVYKSVDTVVDQDQAVNYPTEFLNSLEPSGVPPHMLHLKVGVPIMLLRNIDAPKLCNGTRLSVKNLLPHVIEATILTGCAKGEDVFIPRIPIIPTDLAFEFKRLQFPIRLAFAMTINKAQGQSLKVAGISLENHCFSHGQLYVACSRVGSGKNIYIFAPGDKTTNVVYPKALQ